MSDNNYLNGVYLGKVKACYGIESAIDKLAVTEDIYLSSLGLVGDECADIKHHGGADRALHQYPAEHYDYWAQKYNSDKAWRAPGMGENLSSIGMTETTVCIGDRYHWGQAIIEVSQPRSPCFKLNKRWGVIDLSVHMQDISRCGWLYRVIQPGVVNVAEPLVLIAREANALTVQQTCNFYFTNPLDKSSLLQLSKQQRLAKSWQDKVSQRLATGKLESWNFRLLGHA